MAQKGAGGENGPAADDADIFANLDFEDDSLELGPRPALSNGPGGEGRRVAAALGPEAGNGAAIVSGSSEEQSLDAGAGRQGAKTNADDNPFSFTKFLQGRCYSLTLYPPTN